MSQGLILEYLRYSPAIGGALDIAQHGALIGRSTIGPDSVLRDYATVRADGENIRIGANA